jgi:hypothetical protein
MFVIAKGAVKQKSEKSRSLGYQNVAINGVDT